MNSPGLEVGSATQDFACDVCEFVYMEIFIQSNVACLGGKLDCDPPLATCQPMWN